jgi:hypothetical protein
MIIDELVQYRNQLRATLCRGNDPPFPFPSIEGEIVSEVNFTEDAEWPFTILKAMSRCEDNWASDGYEKRGGGISQFLLLRALTAPKK